MYREVQNVIYKYQGRFQGLKGRNEEFYRWDNFHKDIEVYDHRGRYLGSRDPVTWQNYRPGSGQVIKRIQVLIK